MSDAVQRSESVPWVVTSDGYVIFNPTESNLYQPCIGCYAQGTDTAFLVQGRPWYAAVTLQVFAGLSEEDAVNTIGYAMRDVSHGRRPEDRIDQQWQFLLCRDCAGKASRRPPLHSLKKFRRASDRGERLQPAAVQTENEAA